MPTVTRKIMVEKGGNNVSSLLMKALHDLGWLTPGKCGKRLSIIMDNCRG
jgi:hypothetical protein